MFRKAGFATTLFLLTVLLSVKVSGQACGYSINTMYVRDYAGSPIKNANISVARKDPLDDYNPHFQEASRTYWDQERKAHVYQHGLCGAHKDLVVTISAAGFEDLKHAFNLPLGWQAFAVTLRRKETEEGTIFKALSCTEDATVCVKTIYQ
jgi:hypothetical protein